MNRGQRIWIADLGDIELRSLEDDFRSDPLLSHCFNERGDLVWSKYFLIEEDLIRCRHGNPPLARVSG
ncbi:hypothetical protein D3C79_699100 [compost metagenome]